MSDVSTAGSAGSSAPNTLACGVDEAQAQVKTDTRQYTFSREFRSARLEQMYRAHAFKLGQRRISRLILLFVAFELYIIVSKYAQRPGMRTSVTQLFGPSATLLSSLAFLFSKWNSPSRMPVLLWLLAVSYVSLVLGPMLRDVIDHGDHREHGSAETANGTSHNLMAQPSVLLTGEREHDASWVVGCWYIAAFATAVWGDSSGMGPAGCISLFWILAAPHATTMGLAYSWEWSMVYPDSDKHGRFGTFVPQLVTAGAMNAYLAWIACEASRQMFLATALASMQRMEQLSGEKERLEYERQFAETKRRRAWSNSSSPPHEREAGQEGSLEPEPSPGECSANRFGSESASSNSELRAISVAMRASKARTPESTSSKLSNSSDSKLAALSQKAVLAASKPPKPPKPPRKRKVRICS